MSSRIATIFPCVISKIHHRWQHEATSKGSPESILLLAFRKHVLSRLNSCVSVWPFPSIPHRLCHKQSVAPAGSTLIPPPPRIRQTAQKSKAISRLRSASAIHRLVGGNAKVLARGLYHFRFDRIPMSVPTKLNCILPKIVNDGFPAINSERPHSGLRADLTRMGR